MEQTKKVSEEHGELYHYTTAAGLEGIVRSQQLWATHMGYLNDAEEHSGFFVRRLPRLLDDPARDAVTELMQSTEGRKGIEQVGGAERAIEDFKRELAESARKITFDINEPYVVSFCSGNAHGNANDGLLSQWRGYGTGGGYAIVFESTGLERLIGDHENPAFEYQFANFSDVDYDFPDGAGSIHPEREQWETDVQRKFKEFILSRGNAALHLHTELSALASRYKHHGFAEEKEVRIVVIPIHDEVHKVAVALAREKGHPLKPRKPIKFRESRGVLIPYIELFGGTMPKLPFRRILVGPHPDREKRATAVRALLKQYGLDVTVQVQVSGIPYLGR